MRYIVLVTRSAEKQLKALPNNLQRKVAATLVAFEIEPRPFGSKKMSGTTNTYRVRIGDYRIIYEIEDKVVTVTVLKVAHRKDVYR